MWLFENRRCATLVFLILVTNFCIPSSTEEETKFNIRRIRQTGTETSTSCVCVPYYYCNSENVIITNGESLIDIRQARDSTMLDYDMEAMSDMCEDYLQVCCTLPKPVSDAPTCGLRHANRLQHHIPRLDNEEADHGEFPWMVTIFQNQTVQRNNVTKEVKVYQCQGTLINDRVVLTAAQCIMQCNGSGNASQSLSIRAGQLDTMMTDEELAYQEHQVQETIIHRKYNSNKLQNNIALLILKSPVTINRFVDITCLADHEDVVDETKCLVIGWDKYLAPEDTKTQRSQVNILKRRSQPRIQTDSCTRQLRNTPLGRRFKLDNSSICAGGSPGKNFYSGEIGRPLACPLTSEPKRYVQVGIASWCINSGNFKTPSVFASIAHLRGWIDNQIAKLRLDTSVYRTRKQ